MASIAIEYCQWENSQMRHVGLGINDLNLNPAMCMTCHNNSGTPCIELAKLHGSTDRLIGLGSEKSSFCPLETSRTMAL